jgi:hypothetical protein
VCKSPRTLKIIFQCTDFLCVDTSLVDRVLILHRQHLERVLAGMSRTSTSTAPIAHRIRQQHSDHLPARASVLARVVTSRLRSISTRLLRDSAAPSISTSSGGGHIGSEATNKQLETR